MASLAPLILLFVSTASEAAEPLELRLRIAWGAGASRQWEGEIRVEGGELSDLTDIGLATDSPGSKYLQPRQLHIRTASPVQYDGCDITVSGSEDTALHIEFWPTDQRESKTTIATTLGHFISRYENRRLDELDNRLLVRRVPGDQLRVSFNRNSLVFAPGELFALSVHPHELDVEPLTSLRVKVQIFAARSDKEVWSVQESIAADEKGAFPQLQLAAIPLPKQEGVFDIVVSLYRRTRLVEVPLWRTAALAQRKVQVVVIDPARGAAQQQNQLYPVDWNEQLTIDPANPHWRTWASRLPGLALIPGFDQSKPLGNGPLQEIEVLGQNMLQLAPGQWQAYPIPIDEPGKPYLLEVDYPSDVPQTLGISIIEPNAAGEVAPIGVDSGVHVPRYFADERPAIERHRLIVWPRTTAPVLLLVNHSNDGPALFGRIRLYRGPDTLAPAPIDSMPGSMPERLLAAYFDRPLFPASFSASQDFDPTRQQNLDDWKKFYDGATRLAEYLKYAGYNGAVVCVAREGSTLYPSQILPSSPRFDNGVFFTTGQDAIRKDVLELLFRIFDREGLKLVPAIHFSGRVERLETLLRAGGADAQGLLLVDERGRVASTHYNPLDARVQTVMFDAVREVASRYGHHASYAGISLQLDPDSYAQLPGAAWGLDAKTFNRFLGIAPVDKQLGEQAKTFAARAELLENDAVLQAWIQWRASELSRVLVDMQRLVVQPRSDARLYIATGEMYESRLVQRQLQPALSSTDQPPIEQATLQLGIDAALLRQQTHLVLLRPQRINPASSLNSRAAYLHLETSPAADTLFGGDEQQSQQLAPETGSLFYHERILRKLPSFDEVSPFGPDKTHTQLFAHVLPSGLHNRKRFVHSLAALDSLTMIDGGWMLPRGQEDALLPLIETYRLLPRQHFARVIARSERNTQPVAVRQLHLGNRTYFYLVNESPWTADVSVEIGCAAATKLMTLGRREFPPAQFKTDQLVWKLRLAPYDLVGAWLSDPKAEVRDWQVQLAPQVLAELAAQIRDVRMRADLALERPPLKVLQNPDFEVPGTSGDIAGWQFKQNPQKAAFGANLDADVKHGGRYALRLHSEGDVMWARSNTFPAPTTGRLYVLVRLKTRDASVQPNLRVVLDDDQGFYWPLPVGTAGSHAQLPEAWSEDFLFPFEHLSTEELGDLRLGFDLMGAGEVWIDDIQLYDIWLSREQRNALMIASGLASKNLDHYGKVTYCQRFLDGFWPQFLLQHVPAPTNPATLRTAGLPDAPPSSSSAATEQSAPKQSRIDRMRGLVPKVPIPFRR